MTLRMAAALALLGLTGCSTTPVFNVNYDAVYWPGEERANGPDIIVLVRGNPSTLPKAEFDRSAVHLTVTPFFVQAAVNALKRFPIVNSSLDGDTIDEC